MKCKKCGAEIGFSHYFKEAINPFKRSWHRCESCCEEYRVKNHFWILAILFVMGLKTYQSWMKNTYYIYLDFKEIIILSSIAAAIIYIVCLLEQIIYFMRK